MIQLPGPIIKDKWYVVASVKADLEIDNTTHDFKFSKWAMDGFKELAFANIEHRGFKTCRLPIFYDPHTWTQRVNLPDDFIDYYKISLWFNGKLINLDANDEIDMSSPVLDCCGDELNQKFWGNLNQCCTEQAPCPPANAPCAGAIVPTYQNCDVVGLNGGNWGPGNTGYWGWWGYAPFWSNGQFVAGMYGRGAHRYRGGYRIDWEKRQIVIEECLVANGKICEINLEYKTNGLGDGNFVINDGVENCLRYYVHWQRKMFEMDTKQARMVGRADMAMVNEYKKRFQREAKRCLIRVASFTVQEMLAIHRSSIRQTPKR